MSRLRPVREGSGAAINCRGASRDEPEDGSRARWREIGPATGRCQLGGMLLLSRKKLSGSYFCLRLTSRS